ncbi:hypothetical protein AAFF_G00394240 [Aldrovandia affinis]|uniref:Uncharacterized protein n=1 Tax=Aldrovandia affinis TaxID=143900 RepID=A0AAD7SDM6_9TELE|nr:hypothetical protein AAFF_G00394240 [Aldrovandia affinis]
MQTPISGARSKRDRHPPHHLQDHEVDCVGYKPRATQPYSTAREEYEYQGEGATEMTPLTDPHATPHSHHHGRNPDEQDSAYREFRELPTLFRNELKVIRMENMLLHESQQAIHRDFRRLHVVKEDMRKLVETVCSTKEAQPAAVSHATAQPIPQLPSLGE